MAYISALNDVSEYIGEAWLRREDLSDETRATLNHILAHIGVMINEEIDSMYDYYQKVGLNDE